MGDTPLPPLPDIYQFPYIPDDDKSCSLYNVFRWNATRCPFDRGIYWAARSSSFSWCLPLRRSDSGKPLLTRVLVLSATSFYFFFGFTSEHWKSKNDNGTHLQPDWLTDNDNSVVTFLDSVLTLRYRNNVTLWPPLSLWFWWWLLRTSITHFQIVTGGSSFHHIYKLPLWPINLKQWRDPPISSSGQS